MLRFYSSVVEWAEVAPDQRDAALDPIVPLPNGSLSSGYFRNDLFPLLTEKAKPDGAVSIPDPGMDFYWKGLSCPANRAPCTTTEAVPNGDVYLGARLNVTQPVVFVLFEEVWDSLYRADKVSLERFGAGEWEELNMTVTKIGKVWQIAPPAPPHSPPPP